METLPAGIGAIIPSAEYSGAGSYLAQTPDSLWSTMISRMKTQVDARAAALSAWERAQPAGTRNDSAYWDRYYAVKAQHRVDYPMPWGHVMFRVKRAA